MFANGWMPILASQPWSAFVLLRQSEPRRDPLVGTEQPADEIRAVALLAPMQQHNVIRQSVGAVEEFADGGKGLKVGKVAVAAGDAALEEPWASAVGLHLRVVVALQRDAVKVAKLIEEVARNMAEISGIADAIAKAIHDKAV